MTQPHLRLSLYLSLFFCLSLFLISCNNCRLVDCEGNGGTIQLRLLRNGQNVLYGPDAFIVKDSVRSFVITSFDLERNVHFSDTFQSLFLYVEDSFPVVLELNGMRNDTFSVTTEISGMDECCTGYQLTSVLHNGEVICTGICEEVIDLEI